MTGICSNDQVSQGLASFLRNMFQAAPERLFEADAGFAAVDRNGMSDRRFHRPFSPPKTSR
jgi:hypothetical protein